MGRLLISGTCTRKDKRRRRWEFLGGSGKSGSARYAIINSLGNIPAAYMEFIDGRSYARWGAHAMPGGDAILSAAGAVIRLGWFLSRRHGPRAASECAARRK